MLPVFIGHDLEQRKSVGDALASLYLAALIGFVQRSQRFNKRSLVIEFFGEFPRIDAGHAPLRGMQRSLSRPIIAPWLKGRNGPELTQNLMCGPLPVRARIHGHALL
jgi:hypothetical protein